MSDAPRPHVPRDGRRSAQRLPIRSRLHVPRHRPNIPWCTSWRGREMTRLSPEDIAAEFAPFDGSNPYDMIYLRGLIATAIRRDRSQGKHKVDRSGRVMDGARILGHVDRYDPSKP